MSLDCLRLMSGHFVDSTHTLTHTLSHTLFVLDVLQNMSTGGNVVRNVHSRNTGNMCTHSSVSLHSACRAVYTECSGDVFEIKWEFIRHNWLENGSKLPGPYASHWSSTTCVPPTLFCCCCCCCSPHLVFCPIA